jgi:hypothetical protein
VPELDLRHLDDDEAPVATETRLATSVGRGRKLKRRRTARLSVTAALVLVVATGGALGVAATFAPTRVGIPAASQPGPGTSPPPTTEPVPSEPPVLTPSLPSASPSYAVMDPTVMPDTQMLTTDGLTPYLIGADANQLVARDWASHVGGKTCKTGYYVVAPHSSNDVQLITSGSLIQLVIIKANSKYATPKGAFVGMPEGALVKLYPTIHRVAGQDQSSHGYYVASPQSIGFWIGSDGNVSGMIAGRTQDVASWVSSGMHLEC